MTISTYSVIGFGLIQIFDLTLIEILFFSSSVPIRPVQNELSLLGNTVILVHESLAWSRGKNFAQTFYSVIDALIRLHLQWWHAAFTGYLYSTNVTLIWFFHSRAGSFLMTSARRWSSATRAWFCRRSLDPTAASTRAQLTTPRAMERVTRLPWTFDVSLGVY